MKYVYFLIFLILLSIFSIIALTSRNAIVLNSVDGSEANGFAVFRVNSKDGIHKSWINLEAMGLSLESGKIYEGWLVDEETNYKLSIGSFQPRSNGKGNLRFNGNIVNPFVYDKIVVTQEPLQDINPEPENKVLEGNIEGSIRDAVTLVAQLDSKQEVPSINSRAKGIGIFTINTSDNTISYEINYKNLGSIDIGSHIHGFAMPGETADILFNLETGEEKQGTLNYSDIKDREAEIIAGLTYINVHSEKYPNGEIRGQILFI